MTETYRDLLRILNKLRPEDLDKPVVFYDGKTLSNPCGWELDHCHNPEYGYIDNPTIKISACSTLADIEFEMKELEESLEQIVANSKDPLFDNGNDWDEVTVTRDQYWDEKLNLIDRIEKRHDLKFSIYYDCGVSSIVASVYIEKKDTL